MPGDARFTMRVRVEAAAGGSPRLDLSLQLGSGVTAVMGSSGAGKTSLLSTIAGLIRPSFGRIILDGETFFDSESRIWVPPHQRGLSIVFQSFALFPNMSVWRNVAYGMRRAFGAARRRAALDWLERTQVSHLADRDPATLSGGEAQRVALARALAAEPRMLLLDEPFSAMDSQLRAELGDALLGLIEQVRVPTLLVTHDHGDAARCSTRVLRMERGRIVGVEPPAEPEVTRYARVNAT
jgi:molybdate transport system ATP-binding protein